MKSILSIALLCFFFPVFAQDEPASLAKKLTASAPTDFQKVKAIFNWITENIAYNTRPRARKAVIGQHSSRFAEEMEEDTGVLKSLNERVSLIVLENRIAFCEGYARLFTTLCDYAGVPSVIVPGYAKGNLDRPGNRFGVNHYWNAVYIDSAWQLLDATWASGYVSWHGDEFIRQYDGRYFLPAPEQFVRDHYPDDLQWTLLSDHYTPREFRNSPFKQKSFVKYRIGHYSPSTGIIEAAAGDTLRFAIETNDAGGDVNITPDLLMDTTIYSRSPSSVFLRPMDSASSFLQTGKANYQYTVATGVEWIYLIYNNDLVLRYKLNIRKELGTF